MAAQGGSCKKASKGLEWNSNYDKFIIKWWLERNDIDMSNLMSWGELRQEFSQYSMRSISTATLQNQCVNSTDPMLNVLFEGMLEKRNDFGFSDGMSLNEKLNIMGRRLSCLKELLAEHNKVLPFEVEPRRVQSKLTSFSVGLETPVATVVDDQLATPTHSFTKPVIKHVRTTPRTSIITQTRRSRTFARSELFSKNPEPSVKRHKLDFDRILPMEFQSNEVGAESVDVEGCVLPKQVFKDKTFFLLQDTADYVGKSLYNVQMYLVELHGGKVVERRRDILHDTFFIAPQSGELTDIYKNRFIYRPSLIIEHAKNLVDLTEESSRVHVDYRMKMEMSEAVPIVTHFKKEKIDVDLTEDDDVVLLNPLIDTLKTKNKIQAENCVGQQTINGRERNEPDSITLDNDLQNEQVITTFASTEEPSKAATKDAGQVNKEKDGNEVIEETLKPISNDSTPCTKGQTSGANMDDDLPERVLNGALQEQLPPITWTDDEKRYSFACVFRHSIGGKSAMNICREAAKQLEAERGARVSPETLRTRIRRLEKGMYKVMFDELKQEFQLTEEMLKGFEVHFKEKTTDAKVNE